MEFVHSLKWDNVNVHRAAAKIIVSKSRAARGFVRNALLSGRLGLIGRSIRSSVSIVTCYPASFSSPRFDVIHHFQIVRAARQVTTGKRFRWVVQSEIRR